MVMTVLNAGQFLSNAFASSLVKNVSSPGLPLPFYTALNAMRTLLTTMRTTVPYERFVAGIWPLIMHTMIALFLTMDALCANA
jgi:hypothetical protein